MKIVGLTGGIGSGKTTVANMFKDLNVPVYIADDEAKALMQRSKVIKRKLIEQFGTEAYSGEKPNREYLASVVFKNKEALKTINSIVHPKVASHFRKWLKKQESAYVIKEAAILFENGGYKECDLMIVVVAEVNERIERVIDRDKTEASRVKAIINNQWNDTDKIKLSDFVVYNNNLHETKLQVHQIHDEILKKTQ